MTLDPGPILQILPVRPAGEPLCFVPLPRSNTHNHRNTAGDQGRPNFEVAAGRPRVPANTSSISPVALRFVQRVPLGDIGGFATYTNEHQELWRERDLCQNYELLAISALREGQQSQAENCIEKGLIIENCLPKTTAGRAVYLRQLLQRGSKEAREFDKRFDEEVKYCKEKANKRLQGSSDGRTERRPRIPSREVSELSQGFGELAIHSGSGRQAESNTGGGRHAPLSTSAVPEQGGYQSNAGRVEFVDPYGKPAAIPGRRNTVSSRDHTLSVSLSHDDDKSHWTGLESSPSVRGDKGRMARFEERLDPAYQKRSPRDAGDFFKLGKVFSILTHSEDERSGDANDDRWTTETRQGITIFSHIRRFIVVKEGHGFCWAVPINTYNGRGVSKSGFRLVDVQAHAIAYMRNTKPEALREERIMPKKPIMIEPDRNDGKPERLHKTSRINFSRVSSFEHNLRVKGIGMVVRESLPYLVDHWRKHRDEG